MVQPGVPGASSSADQADGDVRSQRQADLHYKLQGTYIMINEVVGVNPMQKDRPSIRQHIITNDMFTMHALEDRLATKTPMAKFTSYEVTPPELPAYLQQVIGTQLQNWMGCRCKRLCDMTPDEMSSRCNDDGVKMHYICKEPLDIADPWIIRPSYSRETEAAARKRKREQTPPMNGELTAPTPPPSAATVIDVDGIDFAPPCQQLTVRSSPPEASSFEKLPGMMPTLLRQPSQPPPKEPTQPRFVIRSQPHRAEHARAPRAPEVANLLLKSLTYQAIKVTAAPPTAIRSTPPASLVVPQRPALVQELMPARRMQGGVSNMVAAMKDGRDMIRKRGGIGMGGMGGVCQDNEGHGHDNDMDLA